VTVTATLDPQVAAIGKLIGLLRSDDSVDISWFGEPISELESIPTRLDALAALIEAVLGSAAAAPSGLPGSQWYAIPDPATGQPSPLYFVSLPSATPAQMGLGTMAPRKVGSVNAEPFAYVPLVSYDGQGATFLPAPAQVGIRLAPVSDTAFTAIDLVAAIPLTGATPSFTLTFEDTPTPATYHSLADLVAAGIGPRLDEVEAAVQSWLALQPGKAATTVGAILTAAGFLPASGKKFEETLAALKQQEQQGGATAIALTFVKAVLSGLATSGPLIPLPGGGISIAHDATTGDWGVRVVADIPIGSTSPSVKLCLGTWLDGETDAANWLTRSLGSFDEAPGATVYLLNDGSGSGGTKFEFAPRMALVSVGVDVDGAADKPLIDENGYTLRGLQARAWAESPGTKWSYGFAGGLDQVGFPVVPSATGAEGTNPVASNVLASGDKSGDAKPVNPGFSASIGRAWASGTEGKLTVHLADPAGGNSPIVWIPLQSSFGPVHLQRLGLEWPDPNPDTRLDLLFDGSVMLGALEVDLDELTIGIPLKDPLAVDEYTLDLQGLAVTFDSGGVELSGGLLKTHAKDGSVEYDGEALIKAASWAIAAIGAYGTVDGEVSLFVFAQLDAQLGGPPFFFVTGLCAGFGYNRGLRTPSIDEVPQFPLLAGVADPSAIGGKNASPGDALAKLSDWVPAQRGSDWFAAGVQFTSFEIVNSNAVAIVVFGTDFRVLVLGVSRMKLAQSGEQFVYVELDLEVLLDPSQGVLEATAQLSPNSYVLDPSCHLTGGFAFYVWYSGPRAGDFVLTIGGYHPAFQKPEWYPDVPRLGLTWYPTSDVTISGDAYFALTPSCAMAGGGIDVEFSSGDLRAWFTAQADFLFHWKPFYFEGYVGVSIGASYKLDLAFVTITVSVELGASLTIFGPPTGGSVHVDWSIISFTVPFGADPGGDQSFVEWQDFAAMLPQPQKAAPGPAVTFAATADPTIPAQPLGVSISDGLVRLAPDKTTWLVRADALTLEVTTAFPATQVLLVGGGATPQPATPDPLTVRPMGISSGTSLLTVTVETLDNEPLALSLWNGALRCGTAAYALWGPVPSNPQQPDAPTSAAGPSKILGVEGLTPKQAQPVGPPPMPVVNLEFAQIDLDDSDYLPLSAAEAAVTRQPQPATGTLKRIEDGIATATKPQRDDLFAALATLGASPGQNGPTDDIAANLASDFLAEPMLGAPWGGGQ
jgi:hypothetical protein